MNIGQERDCCNEIERKFARTRMTMQQNTRYMKKSPGCENLAAVVSRLLQYVKRKYGSRIIPSLGPVMKKLLTSRHICGTMRRVKTCCGMKAT